MPDYRFSRPIPGQSLTAEPGNAPYERPPEIVDPEEALMTHIDRLNDPDSVVGLVQAVELGLDVVTITEGVLRNAVLKGIHDIDVSILIAPAVHEFIRSNLDILGIEYDNGFGTKEEKREALYSLADTTETNKMLKMARESSGKPDETEKPVPQEAPMMEEPMPPSDGMPQEMAPEQESGLIERRQA